MEFAIKDWIALTGAIVLPIIGFVLTLLISGLRNEIKNLKDEDEALDLKIAKFQQDLLKWHADLPDKYARRDELERNFQQLNQLITRMDDKLERLLNRGMPAE